jgi:hypothetical protein
MTSWMTKLFSMSSQLERPLSGDLQSFRPGIDFFA